MYSQAHDKVIRSTCSVVDVLSGLVCDWIDFAKIAAKNDHS